jgi:hypothetical protein
MSNQRSILNGLNMFIKKITNKPLMITNLNR